MKKIFLLSFILMMTFLSACGSNNDNEPFTWVLEKDRLVESGGIEDYVAQLQNEQPDYRPELTEVRGYNVFTVSEGMKMVVVSTGLSDKTLEFTGADVSENNTTILVKEVNQESEEENSYILIGIEEIKGELTVFNENGDEFTAYEE